MAGGVNDNTDYMVALDMLVKASRWTRAEVVRDGEGCAWFLAARADTPADAAEWQRLGRVVSTGRPQ